MPPEKPGGNTEIQKRELDQDSLSQLADKQGASKSQGTYEVKRTPAKAEMLGTYKKTTRQKMAERNEQVLTSQKLLKSALQYQHGKNYDPKKIDRKLSENTLYLDKDNNIVEGYIESKSLQSANGKGVPHLNPSVHRIIRQGRSPIIGATELVDEGVTTGYKEEVSIENVAAGTKTLVITSSGGKKNPLAYTNPTTSIRIQNAEGKETIMDDDPSTDESYHPDKEKHVDKILKDVEMLLQRVYDKNVRKSIEDFQVKNDQKEAEDLLGELEDMYT